MNSTLVPILSTAIIPRALAMPSAPLIAQNCSASAITRGAKYCSHGGMTISPETALVLFSGGQDSTVCLAWALQRFARVETVGFDYGQRHAVELAVRPGIREQIAKLHPGWAGRLGDDHMVKLDALAAISDTALTRDMAIEMGEHG